MLAAGLIQCEEDEVLKGQLAQVEDHVERHADLPVPEVHQDDFLLVRARLQHARLTQPSAHLKDCIQMLDDITVCLIAHQIAVLSLLHFGAYTMDIGLHAMFH